MVTRLFNYPINGRGYRVDIICTDLAIKSPFLPFVGAFLLANHSFNSATFSSENLPFSISNAESACPFDRIF